MEVDVETISRLRCQLREAEEERRKAAQYGLKLIENENLLQNQLDELQTEMVTITEVSFLTLNRLGSFKCHRY